MPARLGTLAGFSRVPRAGFLAGFAMGFQVLNEEIERFTLTVRQASVFHIVHARVGAAGATSAIGVFLQPQSRNLRCPNRKRQQQKQECE
jgi:hypothetical protein